MVETVDSLPLLKEGLADIEQTLLESLVGLALPAFNYLIALNLVVES